LLVPDPTFTISGLSSSTTYFFGVTAVEGTFARGDAVAVKDRKGHLLAHGLAEYDAEECQRLCGKQSAEHAAILGYAPRNAVIHRDQLVVL